VRIDVTESDVTLRLAPAERVAALRGDIRIPREAITAAEALTDPPSPLWELSVGLRAPGWRYRCTSLDGTRFWALDRGGPALRIRFDAPGRLREVTVTTRDADALARELRGGGPAPGGW
jgi:hypothetical protein